MDKTLIWLLIVALCATAFESDSDLSSEEEGVSDWDRSEDEQLTSDEASDSESDLDSDEIFKEMVDVAHAKYMAGVTLTAAQVECACETKNAEKYYKNIQEAMDKFRISKTKQRTAAFLAQTCHESGHYPDVFNERWTLKKTCGGWRREIHEGNKCKWFGRGAIQITGKTNYRKASKYFEQDWVTNPDPVANSKWAFATAAWWWAVGSTVPGCKNLNDYADRDSLSGFDQTTRCIFGNNYKTSRWAANGTRRKMYQKALKCLA